MHVEGASLDTPPLPVPTPTYVNTLWEPPLVVGRGLGALSNPSKIDTKASHVTALVSIYFHYFQYST